jgi:hypothetical protein
MSMQHLFVSGSERMYLIGVEVKDWGIKRMKTKWGTCTIAQRRIWLNLELAQDRAKEYYELKGYPEDWI